MQKNLVPNPLKLVTLTQLKVELKRELREELAPELKSLRAEMKTLQSGLQELWGLLTDSKLPASAHSHDKIIEAINAMNKRVDTLISDSKARIENLESRIK